MQSCKQLLQCLLGLLCLAQLVQCFPRHDTPHLHRRFDPVLRTVSVVSDQLTLRGSPEPSVNPVGSPIRIHSQPPSPSVSPVGSPVRMHSQPPSPSVSPVGSPARIHSQPPSPSSQDGSQPQTVQLHTAPHKGAWGWFKKPRLMNKESQAVSSSTTSESTQDQATTANALRQRRRTPEARARRKAIGREKRKAKLALN